MMISMGGGSRSAPQWCAKAHFPKLREKNTTGPWPLDDLHLQYINITFFIIFIWSGGSIYTLAKISQLIQSTVWLPHAGHIINIHE